MAGRGIGSLRDLMYLFIYFCFFGVENVISGSWKRGREKAHASLEREDEKANLEFCHSCYDEYSEYLLRKSYQRYLRIPGMEGWALESMHP